MTLEEYEQIVGNALVVAHNDKDMGALMAVFSRADQTLENSNIPRDAQRGGAPHQRQKVSVPKGIRGVGKPCAYPTDPCHLA